MVFQVNLTVKSVFQFLIKRAYSSQYGRMSLLGGGILVALAAILLGKDSSNLLYSIILFALGIVLPCSTPVNIYQHAKMSVNEAIPEHYIINQEQLVYSHLGHSMDIPWTKVGNVYEYSNGLLIDLKINQIALIPKECVENQYEEIKLAIAKFINITDKNGK